MGYYIDIISTGEVLPSVGKAEGLIMDGAEELEGTPEFQPDLVCVVSNMFFDAAMYVHSQKEYDFITSEEGYRTKVWLVYPHAAEMSGFTGAIPKFKKR